MSREPLERRSYEQGVLDLAALLLASEPSGPRQDRIHALAMGLLHGTLGPGR